jgi:hypothetical protein
MKNRMKYIFLCAGGAFLMIASCSKKLDEAYVNPNAATRVPVEQVFSSLIGTMIGNSAAAANSFGLAGDAVLIGRYIQYWGTYSTTFSSKSLTASNQSNYDMMGGTVGTSDNLGNVWGMYYFSMGQNLNRVVEWGTEEEKWDYVGAALALRAWGMLHMTNQYNHMVLRQAFNTSLQQFTYEDQPEVYDSVRVICFRALGYLNRSDGNQGQNFAAADAFLNGGDKNKWKKFVYGVLARSYGSIVQKNISYADSVIKYADLSCASNADNITCKFAATPISGTNNYYGTTRGNIGSIRQGSYIADLMSGANTAAFGGAVDPRAAYMLRENPNGTYKGIVPWKGSSGLVAADRPAGFWGRGYDTTGAPAQDTGRYIFRNNAEFPVMTASEMQFLKAEAALRKGDKPTALTAYVNGISLNFDMLTSKYEINIRPGRSITPASKAAYLANTDVVPATAAGLTLAKIMLQKYIALFGWGVHETWVDMRRYHYTDTDPVAGGQVYLGFIPPLTSGTELYDHNGGQFVYRARMRYNSEYLYDIPSLLAIGAVSDIAGTPVLNYHTFQPWFSKP